MEHSRREVLLPAALVALDIAGRLALPAALFAYAHGAADLAIVAAVTSTAASSLRGFALGLAVERALVTVWERAVRAALRAPSIARSRAPEEVIRLIEAVRETAMFDAQVVPLAIAHGLSLAAVAVAVVVVLGPAWLLGGGAGGLAIAALLALGQRRLRAASERAWSRLREVARDTSVLIEASALLRAHDREASFAQGLLVEARAMAREERTASTWAAALGLLPAAVVVLAVVLPAGNAGLGSLLGADAGGLADVGILGGAALLVGLSFARVVEQAMRSAPQRATFRAFERASEAPLGARRAGETPLTRSLAEADVRFEDVSCIHEGAACATPEHASHAWTTRGGLALLGANGAGKSTLALALIGLVAPTGGRVTVDGVALHDLDPSALRSRVAYLPQSPFFAPDASIAWHLRLLAPGDVSDARIDEALATVGLARVLGEHAARTGKAPRDVPAGELSGGERQRMHLARVLLSAAELVILDEPEVALDDAGRALLRGLLERLAEGRRVLVVAHDTSIVPASFARLTCVRGEDTRRVT